MLWCAHHNYDVSLLQSIPVSALARRQQKDPGMTPSTKIVMMAVAVVCATSFEPSYLRAQTANSPRTQDSAIGGTLDAGTAVPVKRRSSSADISTDKQPAADKAATSAVSSK